MPSRPASTRSTPSSASFRSGSASSSRMAPPGLACRARHRRRAGAPAMADDRGEPGRQASLLFIAVRDAVSGRRLLEPGYDVLVGVSGGADSVALPHALVLLRPRYRRQVTVGHVHRGLRPEADRDAAFVETLAARFGCAARIVRVSVPRGAGLSPEEA